MSDHDFLSSLQGFGRPQQFRSSNNNGVGNPQQFSPTYIRDLGGDSNLQDPTQGNGLGLNVNTLQTLGQFGNLGLGIANYRQGRDQFNLAKDSFNKNLKNQATSYRNNLEGSGRLRLESSGQFDRSTPEGRAQLERELASYVQSRNVSGSPV